MMKKPIVDETFLLEKMPGKGGWTYVFIPDLSFGEAHRSLWMPVEGSIDDQTFPNLSLAKVKGGGYFFPVKAAIRKLIRKQAGDLVKLILYEDLRVFQLPEELLTCLKVVPEAYTLFMNLKENRQQEFVHWIYAAKREETRAERMNITINKLLKGERLHVKKV